MNNINSDELVLIKTIEHKVDKEKDNIQSFTLLGVGNVDKSKSGKQAKEKYETKDITDELGRIVVSKFYCNKKLISINKYKYDAASNEICNIFIQKGSHSLYSESRRYYNEENQCIKMESSTNPKVIESIYFYTYDNQGNCTAIICRNPEGDLNHKFLYMYDYQQREIHERCIKGNGHVAWYANHFYNSKFKLLEKLYYKKDLLFYKIKCTYDLEGNKTLTRKYLHDSYLTKLNGLSKIDFYLYL